MLALVVCLETCLLLFVHHCLTAYPMIMIRMCYVEMYRDIMQHQSMLQPGILAGRNDRQLVFKCGSGTYVVDLTV